MERIRARHGDSLHLPSTGEQPSNALPTIPEETEDDLYKLWLEDPTDFTPFMEEGQIDFQAVASEVQATDIPHADITDDDGDPLSDHSLRDLMVGVEVLLPQGEGTALCKVLRRSVDKDGKTTGVYDTDPSLDTMTMICDVWNFPMEWFSSTVPTIAQNVLEQVEDDGHYSVKLGEVDSWTST